MISTLSPIAAAIADRLRAELDDWSADSRDSGRLSAALCDGDTLARLYEDYANGAPEDEFTAAVDQVFGEVERGDFDPLYVVTPIECPTFSLRIDRVSRREFLRRYGLSFDWFDNQYGAGPWSCGRVTVCEGLDAATSAVIDALDC